MADFVDSAVVTSSGALVVVVLLTGASVTGAAVVVVVVVLVVVLFVVVDVVWASWNSASDSGGNKSLNGTNSSCGSPSVSIAAAARQHGARHKAKQPKATATAMARDGLTICNKVNKKTLHYMCTLCVDNG